MMVQYGMGGPQDNTQTPRPNKAQKVLLGIISVPMLNYPRRICLFHNIMVMTWKNLFAVITQPIAHQLEAYSCTASSNHRALDVRQEERKEGLPPPLQG